MKNLETNATRFGSCFYLEMQRKKYIICELDLNWIQFNK